MKGHITHGSSKRLGDDGSSGASSSQANNHPRGGRTVAPIRPNQQANTSSGTGKTVQTRQNTQGQMTVNCY
ncbi:unnamed protein product [Ilex paraguariensis]|uniref:Uncharacterized protein n=1 Tax=Ilex paraguariensis TaxID=185542 RepID=A0ABC8ULP6_9AQUA